MFLCFYICANNRAETFSQINSSNHENCKIKHPLNTYSGGITICQISFEIYIHFLHKTTCSTVEAEN